MKKFAYTVNLVNPDGTPFTLEGVEVGICTLEGNCLTPVAPVNGTALIEADKGNYHVKVDLPAGYAYENDTDGYYTGENFSAESTVMTITIYPVTVIDPSKAGMTDAEKAAFAQKPGIYGFDTEHPAYKFSKLVAAESTVYFSLTPEVTGNYSFYNSDTLNYYLNGQTFVKKADEKNTVSQYVNLDAGRTYYFSVVNNAQKSEISECVVVIPLSSYIEYNGVGGELELTIGKEKTNAIIEFNPTSAGAYKLTVQGTTPAIVESPSFPSDTVYSEPDNYSVGANATTYYSTFDFNDANKRPIYFTVTVEKPASVTVKLEKVQEAKDSYVYAEVKEKLTKYADVNGKVLLGVPMDGSASIEYDDNVYLYNGKVVVVMITGNIGSDRFSEGCPLAYIGKDVGTKPAALTANYTVTTTASEGYGISIVDYTRFLRGFKDYKEGENGMYGTKLEIPDTLEVENCYTNFVNADGVYPLTTELKEFLEAFYTVNEDAFLWQIPEEADLSCGWMFPLYYYDEQGEVTTDPLVGEYQLVSYKAFELSEEDWTTKIYTDYVVDGTNVLKTAYNLTVNANNTFVLSQWSVRTQDQFPIYEGTWSLSEGTYSFVVPEGTQNADYEPIDLHFTIVFNESTSTVKVTCVEDPSGDQTTEWVFLNKKADPEN